MSSEPAGSPLTDPQPDGKVMSLAEHLSELRFRLFIAILAVVIGSIIGWLVAPQVLALLKAPIPGPLRFTAPGGALFLLLKLSVMIGLALASPVVLYQLWAFVSPGLTSRERRASLPWIPLALVFLMLGIGVAYVVLPYTAAFLLSFSIPGVVEPLITADAYFGFVTTMFLAFGLVMQFPIVIVLLSKVGLVNADRLRRGRRYVFVGIFVIAVVVTPGGDPFSPTIMALVMYPLYELTIRLVARSSRRADLADDV